MKKEDVDYVMNLLRQGTIKWPGRAECLRRARKKVLIRYSKKTGQPVFKFHWQCAICKKWAANVKAMEVDHIKEIGGFNGNWQEMIPKFYCGQENLQALCMSCHLKKTKIYSSALHRYVRKK